MALGLGLVGSAVPAQVTAAQAKEVAEGDVIVIMRDQLPGISEQHSLAARSVAAANSQSSVVSQLQRLGARKVTSFSTINAFSTKVSASESALLSANPAVQAVVPDRILSSLRHSQSKTAETGASATLGVKAATSSTATAGLCGTLEPEALQLTNTAFLDSTTDQAQLVLDGNHKPVTGTGVTVAFIADGLDTTVPGFIRPDGSHVFVDYEDFSGDPAGTATAGGEAFGDASSIAAQDMPNGKPLYYDISTFVNAAHPLPSPCNIRIRGMAPGASLMGLKVFSQLGYTTTSGFVQAIEYAVSHGADIINESFGGNPYPDTANDPISLADSAAVAAGVTVTVSSGDAAMNTLGSPSTDTDVIAAGASTQFRSYAQTGYGAQALATGYVSNNISALSSGGFSQFSPRTVDVVAPGDLGWALCSSNVALYNDCTNYQTPAVGANIQDFGGTSEAAPLTAGEAALVIQAYRSTHGGKSPSPAVVKQIIMSSATDLGALPSEQGAGLINALGAVHMALSYVDSNNGHPGAHGHGLLASPTSAGFEADPNTRETQSFTITNTGAAPRTVSAALQKLGDPIAGATTSVTLSPSTDPTFINPTGSPRSYVKRTFHVPTGAQHLDASIAYQVSLYSTATPIVYIALLDPSGRQVAYSLPQGLASGYGHVDVVKPTPGNWTALIWTRPSGTGSYAGPVQFTWAAENYVNFGTVYPSSVTLKEGETKTFTASFFMPTEPGDLAAAVKFTETDGSYDLPEIPVVLRTIVPVGATGGSFTGTLTGGNGRAGVGPYQTFEFDVPAGLKNMNLAFTTSDNGYLLEGVLVDPNGMQLSVEPNLDPSGDLQYGIELSRENPYAGRWKFVLIENFTASGNQTSLPFTAKIGFNNALISASGLPTSASTVISASGKPVTATITIINNGVTTEAYFADARLTSTAATALPPVPCTSVTTLPGTCGEYYVPTQVSTIAFSASSSVPINMDAYNFVGYNVGGTGSPDLFAKPTGKDTVTASLTEPEIPWGSWYVIPAEIGPYSSAGAATVPVSISAVAVLKSFDTTVSSDAGDIWADLTLGTNTFNPLLLPSGTGGTITVTIAPSASDVGKTVTGYLYIDTFNGVVGTGDEVVRLPYTYTVAP
jgi:hypothetical protein